MKANLKEFLRRGALILALTAFCITGSYVFAHRKAEVAMQTEGHGECSQTESYIREAPREGELL